MSFHLYRINELYSNADGTIQFIELSNGPTNGEGFWAGQNIKVTQGGTTHTYNFVANLPSTSATANTTVLIATQGFADLGIATPNFIVPSGFLFTSGGGTVNFAGVDSVSYSSLPLDGVHAVDRSGTMQVNTPRNFAGTTGTALPSPSVKGGTGNDTLSGGSGNDFMMGGAGNDAIDGASGTNTAVYSGNRAGYTVANSGGNITVTDNGGSEGSDTLTNIQRVWFGDKYLAFDAEGDAGIMYRIYQAAFDRVPDLGGLGYWISQREGGTSFNDIASFFVSSSEFQSLYGANPTNSTMVTALYQNVLNRAPDQGGFDYWTGQLSSGAISRPNLLIAFADSPENRAQVSGAIQNGMEYTAYVAAVQSSGGNITTVGTDTSSGGGLYGY